MGVAAWLPSTLDELAVLDDVGDLIDAVGVRGSRSPTSSCGGDMKVDFVVGVGVLEVSATLFSRAVGSAPIAVEAIAPSPRLPRLTLAEAGGGLTANS